MSNEKYDYFFAVLEAELADGMPYYKALINSVASLQYVYDIYPKDQMDNKMIKIKTNVASLQAFGCWLCLHMGSIAILIGKHKGKPCFCRVEILTPRRKFRIS